jgi:hypothetical protein
MKCVGHWERDAVAPCQDCGAGLCGDCHARYVEPLCGRHAALRARAVRGSVIRALAIALGLAGLGFEAFRAAGVGPAIGAAYVAASVYFGWGVVRNVVRGLSGILVVPIAGAFTYLLVLLVCATLIGVLVTPISIARKLRAYASTGLVTADV